MRRLKRLTDTGPSGALFDRQYAYNAANQISQITELTGTRMFGYDNVNRLTSVNGSATENYLFDDVGNITSSHRSSSYGYQPFNKIASTQTATYGSDANGNMTTKSEGSNFWRYGWDYENRLATASTRKQTVRYKYDALGRRVARNLGYGKELTKFTYDALDVLVDDNNGTQTKYLNGSGIDNKLRQTVGSTTSYFLADHLGSTNGLASSSGSLTASNSYDSFGNPSNTNFSSRYQFTGREYDSFSGLQFSRARFYDPNLGRFISEDPIGFKGGDMNLYGSVWNNPQNLVDPLGTDGCRRLPNGRCAPIPQEPTGPGEPPRRPPHFISDPPIPTSTPWTPPPPIATPPTSDSVTCECETAFPRFPDFYSGSFLYPIPHTGGFLRVGGTFTVDRHGQMYLTPGASVGFPPGPDASATAGYLLQRCKPTPQETANYLTGFGGGLSAFSPYALGGGIAASSGGVALSGGLGTPGVSLHGGYGFQFW